MPSHQNITKMEIIGKFRQSKSGVWGMGKNEKREMINDPATSNHPQVT
jgi:hypothetical protein